VFSFCELLTLTSNFDKGSLCTDNESPMDVTLALLADAANVSQEGKLNILGAFANINAVEFPARHPEMQLVLRFEASPAEAETNKRLEVKILDEDGQAIGGFGGEFKVSAATSGQRIRMQTVMRILDAVFPRPGDYTFAVLIDDKTEYEVPLSLTLMTAGEEKNDGD